MSTFRNVTISFALSWYLYAVISETAMSQTAKLFAGLLGGSALLLFFLMVFFVAGLLLDEGKQDDAVLDVIKRHPLCGGAEIEAKTGLPTNEVRRSLARLEKHGHIRRPWNTDEQWTPK